jgi:uncharacterized protein YkwD
MLGRTSIAVGLGAAALVLAGGGGAGAQAQCPNADSGPEAGTAALAAATECLIAVERAAAGLRALTPNAALRTSAARHAADMVERRYLSATSPGGVDQEERATQAGYGTGDVRISIGEAFGFGSGSEATPRRAVARWRADPNFRRVILDAAARDIGAGAALGSPRGGAGGVTYVADLGRVIALATPEAGKTVGVGHVSGIVRVAEPGSNRYTRLRGKRIVPVGSRLDARDGVVRVRSASDLRGGIQRAIFYDGMFRVGQRRPRGARAAQAAAAPVTELRLFERLAPCRPTAGAARVFARKPPRKRRVWGSGKGKFRTRGRYGTATVVGTRWLVEDSCAGTRVTVRSGVVKVRDSRTGRTRTVRAGRSVLLRRR